MTPQLPRLATVRALTAAAVLVLATAALRSGYADPPLPGGDSTETGDWVLQMDPAGAGGWKPDDILPGKTDEGQAPAVVEGAGPAGENALAVEARFPGVVGAMRAVADVGAVLGRGTTLRAEVYLPEGFPPDTAVQLLAQHEIWGWFAAVPTRLLTPGQWTTVRWPLSDESADWTALSSVMEWNGTIRQGLARLGLRFFAKEQAQGRILVARVAVEGLGEAPPALAARDVRASDAPGQVGRRWELTFDLTRSYDNPFDPDVVAVDVVFTQPAGAPAPRQGETEISVPAFYYQDFVRQRLTDHAEGCTPRGRACWKARFTPLVAGRHSYTIQVRDRTGETWESQPIEFDVAANPDFKGFLRVDPADPRYLSFTNGAFYYPVGVIVRSPGDDRRQYAYDVPDTTAWGTFAYDDYFTSMSAAGMNFTRVWMSAWWTALEWSHGYGEQYGGLGHYNLLNAWRMDYLVDLAERQGIYIDVTLHNHGQFRANDFDQEWYDNAYYAGQGGVVQRPEEFWTDEKARAWTRKRIRYISARWGASPAIAWWELCNETDLIGNYDTSKVAPWHREMSRYFHEVDPYRHLVTTHYTSNRLDRTVQAMPEIQVCQSTAYRADMVARVTDLFQDHSVFGKPVFLNEYGVGNGHLELHYNLHAGLWVSAVEPLCGAALFWWWPYVQAKNEYFQYQALMRYHLGEDYRGRDFQLTRVALTAMGSPALALAEAGATTGTQTVEVGTPLAVGMQNDHEAHFWVYDPRIYRSSQARSAVVPVAQPVGASRAKIDGLTAGRYRLEVWDTWKGEVTERRDLAHAGGTLAFDLPAFERDFACKVKRVGDL